MAVKINILYTPRVRPARQMTIVAKNGQKVSLWTNPSEFDFEHVPNFGTVDREGRTSLTRMTDPGLREFSFSHIVANLSFERNINEPIWKLQRLIRTGQKIRFTGGANFFSGPVWYHVIGFKIKAKQLSGHNQISRAELFWTLREAVDYPALIKKRSTKKAKPKPRKSQTKKPKKQVQRTYKIKKGDSLFKIASKYLGKGSRWPEIWKLNKKAIPNPNRIKVGKTIKLPKK